MFGITLKRMGNSTKPIRELWRVLGVGSVRASSCDSGKCSKENTYMKGLLNSQEMGYLQPARKQINSRKFQISKPVIEPVVNYLLEEQCRKNEACKNDKEKANKKK